MSSISSFQNELSKLNALINSKDLLDSEFYNLLKSYMQTAVVYAKFVLAADKESITTAIIIDVVNALDTALIRLGPSATIDILITSIELQFSTLLKSYNSQWKYSHNTLAPTQLECDPAFLSLTCLQPNLTLEGFILNKSQPFIIRNAIADWEAMAKWKNFDIFREKYGHRLVPVEVGTSYLRDNWSQKLMPLGQLCENIRCKNSSELLYLAQHDIFYQIPELKSDIDIPQYILDPDQTIINFWMGMANTESPLHFDKYENFFCQVIGYKELFLLASSFNLGVKGGKNCLDEEINLKDLLNSGLPVFSCILGPGDLCYIPKKWWHQVKAVSESISVSFWH